MLRPASKRLVSQLLSSSSRSASPLLLTSRILRPQSPVTTRITTTTVPPSWQLRSAAYQTTTNRTMASSAAAAADTKKMYEWLVILPDHAGALSKRMEVRPSHLKNAKALSSEGRIVLGGAMLDEQPAQPGDPPKINGSALIVKAETRAEVEELVKSDVYAKDVWDISKVQIYPFVSAIRNGL